MLKSLKNILLSRKMQCINLRLSLPRDFQRFLTVLFNHQYMLNTQAYSFLFSEVFWFEWLKYVAILSISGAYAC